MEHVLACAPVDAHEYSLMKSSAVDYAFHWFLTEAFESAQLTECQKSCAELFPSDSLVRCAAVVCLRAPRDQCSGMTRHPSDERVPYRHTVTDFILKVAPQRAQVVLQRFDTHLCRPVGLRVVLRRVLLKDLGYTVDSEFSERFRQEFEHRRFIVTF